MKTIVLAGGKGTRLGLADRAKVMVPIDGVPLLQRTLANAVGHGFTELIFLTGYLSDEIEHYFGDGSQFGAKIEYIREAEPLGTAGCFNQIRDRLTEPFLVLYGDILLDVDLAAFSKFALEKGSAGTLFAHPNDHPFDSDLLEVDERGRILSVHSKPHLTGEHFQNLVSAALYVLFPEALRFVDPYAPSDWGRDVFPRLANEAPLYAYRSCEYAKDIGTPGRLSMAERHLREGRLARLALRTAKPAIFLDRDGVINEERGGVHRASDVKLIKGSASAIKSFNEAAVPVICVTNQPDLAKGMMTWTDLRSVMAEIDHQLAEEAGAYIDDIFVCPHHPDRGWPGEVPELKVACDCRKPADGLILRAAERHHIDLGRSWMIGDRYCDIAAASTAGLRSVLVSTGHGGDDKVRYQVRPDRYCTNLNSAAGLILKDVV